MLRIAPHKRIILAFDKSTFDGNDLRFFKNMKGRVGLVKLGLETISAISEGNSIPIDYRLLPVLKENGIKVMADWKLKDIPNTIGKSVANIAQHDAWGVTVHADTGKESMKAAVVNRRGMNIIGVTVLTSIDEKECKSLSGRIPKSQVASLVDTLLEAGAQAVVCSPLEIDTVRKAVGDKLLIITPGIRAKDAKADDQNRTMTAREAIQAGADYLVIGRPIMTADSPAAAAEAIAEEIASAEANLAMV